MFENCTDGNRDGRDLSRSVGGKLKLTSPPNPLSASERGGDQRTVVPKQRTDTFTPTPSPQAREREASAQSFRSSAPTHSRPTAARWERGKLAHNRSEAPSLACGEGVGG